MDNGNGSDNGIRTVKWSDMKVYRYDPSKEEYPWRRIGDNERAFVLLHYRDKGTLPEGYTFFPFLVSYEGAEVFADLYRQRGEAMKRRRESVHEPLKASVGDLTK